MTLKGTPRETRVSGSKACDLYYELEYTLGHLKQVLEIGFEQSHFFKLAIYKKLGEHVFCVRYIKISQSQLVLMLGS